MGLSPEVLESLGLPPVGSVLGGRYRLDSLLGKGGVGVVYRGFDKDTDRPVAVKVLPAKLDKGVVRQRFEREAKLAASLNHANVVRVFDAGLLPEGLPFLVLELLYGESLAQRIERQGAASLARAGQVTHQLLLALEAAHEHGVLHRDVKPANVFLQWGPSGQVKLIDFGVARDLTGDLTQLTEPGLAVGTPAYMAPELVVGKPADERTDLYGVGATLYEMLTGVALVEHDKHVHKMFKSILSLVPRAPGELRPDGDERFDAIVLRALAKKPEDRYQTAREMRADVEKVLRVLDAD